MNEPAAGHKPKHGLGAAARFHSITAGLGLEYSINWDDADRWLAPDVLTPAQWRRKPELCGCRLLLRAVLIDAFDALQRPPPGQRRLFEECRRETRVERLKIDK